MTERSSDRIRATVRKRYACIATREKGSYGCSTPSCCSTNAPSAKAQSAKLGYSKRELEAVPEGANMGLGCGNPGAIAGLSKGEVVLDLGAGGGFEPGLHQGLVARQRCGAVCAVGGRAGREAGEKGRMKALVVVDAGICGFQTRIHAESEDAQTVTFKVASACEKARTFGEALAARGPVDGYGEIGAGAEGVVLTTARATLKGCCAACAVPVAAFKAMQVAARVALPADVTLKISAE